MHKLLTNLSDADVIVHSGDFTMYGKDGEVMAFVDWFCDCPIKYKIFVAGNHDCLYDADLSGQDKSCYYLCNSGIYLEGVSFYGIPMFVGDIRTGNAGNNVYAIPQNTDVLISHQPPLGILDFADNQYYGDEDLLRKVHQIKPKFHLFGHVHTACGIETHDSITFSNAALVNERYELLQVRLNCKRYYPYSPLNDLRYLP